MFDDLTNLGYGIITFAIVIGVGAVLLYQFGGAVGCATDYTFNATAGNCYETANTSHTTALSGTSYTNVNYLAGQMGQSGLAGWTPAIIAFSVGMLFLGAFFIKGGRRY